MSQSSKDVRAGGAFYELWGKDGLSGLLESVKKRVVAFNAFLSKVGRNAALAAGAVTAPLTALFKGGVDRAADLARLSQQLGLPIEMLHRFQYAAEAAGVSLDEVMQDWTGRYSDLIARAPKIDPKDAQAAASAQLELSDATRSLQLALLPLVQVVARYVTKLSQWVKYNADTAKTVFTVGLAVLGFAAGLKLLTMAFAALGPVAAAAWVAAAGPVGLFALSALTGLAGGVALASYLLDDFEGIKKTARDLGDTLGTAFGGIKDALAKANIALAWQVLLKTLKVYWLEFVDSMGMVWVGFKMTFVDAWHDVIRDIKVAWAKFSAWLNATMLKTVAHALDAVSMAASAVGDMDSFNALQQAGGQMRSAAMMHREKGAAEVKGIKDKADAEEAERRKSRMDDLMESRDRLNQAKAELAALRKQAAEPVAEAPNPFAKNSPLRQGLGGDVAVKGSFSGAALGQSLGISDRATRQTELLKGIQDLLKENPDAVARALAPLVGAPPIR